MYKNYQECTNDRGCPKFANASDGNSYILTSSGMKDLYRAFLEKWERNPSPQWFRKNAKFKRVKEYSQHFGEI